MSAAISAAMAVNTFYEKTGDVKERTKERRRPWKGKAKTGDVPLVSPLARSLG